MAQKGERVNPFYVSLVVEVGVAGKLSEFQLTVEFVKSVDKFALELDKLTCTLVDLVCVGKHRPPLYVTSMAWAGGKVNPLTNKTFLCVVSLFLLNLSDVCVVVWIDKVIMFRVIKGFSDMN